MAGKVFDRTVNLDAVPDAYRATDDREALKVMIALYPTRDIHYKKISADLWLASADGAFTVGHTLVVDGEQTIG